MNNINILDFSRVYEKLIYNYFLADRNINIQGYYYIYWLVRKNDKKDNDILTELYIINELQSKVDKFSKIKPFFSFIPNIEWSKRFVERTSETERINLISDFNISFDYTKQNDPIFNTFFPNNKYNLWKQNQCQIKKILFNQP